ncbi:MAG TPA: efflux RND transporter periplasmic adaptor subunit [Pirellulales bacterium]|nr:efflux RND transporter periplasmic adaptor subunit [Pirellulales bacterium]
MATIGGVGCHKAPAKAGHTEPAKVAHPAKEGELNTIELTPEAEQRLGIETVAVERKVVRRRRTYGGEVVLPTGASITVTAPTVGTLKPVSEGSVPDVGTRIEQNEPLFLLLPLLSRERDVLTPAERIAVAQARLLLSQQQVDADGQLKQAQTRVDAAEIDLGRIERQFSAGAATRGAVDTARAQLALMQKALAAAEQRCELFEKIELEAEAGDATPIPIVSPRNGYLRVQQATIGQIVSAGAPLFEVMDYDPIWIKVPIYAGELPSIAESESALVAGLGDADPADARAAEPVQAPPSADPQAATVDLFYRLDNRDGQLRPGQRLNVTLALRDKAETLVIPWSAVVHDIYGGTWVYVTTSPHQFVRRRVQVPFVSGDLAVIESGPGEGSQVVIAGVAELYGTEFGASH